MDTPKVGSVWYGAEGIDPAWLKGRRLLVKEAAPLRDLLTAGGIDLRGRIPITDILLSKGHPLSEAEDALKQSQASEQKIVIVVHTLVRGRAKEVLIDAWHVSPDRPPAPVVDPANRRMTRKVTR